MARRPRSSKLEDRTNRLKLPVQKRPHSFTTIAPGIALAYRRCKGAGRWIVRVADGKGSSWQKGFAIADDFEDANGESVLTFWQAQTRAKELARGTVETGRPITVTEALDAYAADLKSASVNRTTRQLKAALNLAHRLDPTRITNTHAWKVGLASLRDTHRPRDAVLSDEQVRALIEASHSIDPAFGMYTETAAVTGARPSQLVKLEVGDLQHNGDGSRLMMPSSRKGHAGKQIVRKPVPIPASLAMKLRQAAAGRDASERLLLRTDGAAWSATSADHRRPFEAAVARAKLKPSTTFYSLRHSSIVRQILAGTPLRVIADAHDTSTKEIERTYSAFISGHSDAVLRKGLLDTAQPSADNVVPMPRKM